MEIWLDPGIRPLRIPGPRNHDFVIEGSLSSNPQ